MELGGKFISIHVEVGSMLCHSWFYVMTIVSSLFFRTLQFLHQAKIVTMDQLNYWTSYLHQLGLNNVYCVDDLKLYYESVELGFMKDSSLMGTFPLSTLNTPPKFSTFHTVLTLSQQSLGSYDPRVIPSPIVSSLPISQDICWFPTLGYNKGA